jgi:hypothetical protein
MIMTDEQRRWWFATHPEYSGHHPGTRRPGTQDKKADAIRAQAEGIDAYVKQRLKYETDQTAIELLKIMKQIFGTGGEWEQAQHDSGHPASDPNSYDQYEDVLDRITGADSKDQAQPSPYEGTHLVYKDGQLSFHDDSNNEIIRIPATSGEPGVADPKLKGKGPIPPGTYWFDPSEISPSGVYRKYFPRAGDWGDYRVRLYPVEGTDTHGRTNFFLHGGEKPGSAGCIDIGNADRHFFPLLMKLKGPIYIKVK